MEDDDISAVHMIFQKLNNENFWLEKVISIANELITDYPIEKLLKKNKSIKFETDSPFVNPDIKIDENLSKVANSTNNTYIEFKYQRRNKFIDFISEYRYYLFWAVVLMIVIYNYY